MTVIWAGPGWGPLLTSQPPEWRPLVEGTPALWLRLTAMGWCWLA